MADILDAVSRNDADTTKWSNLEPEIRAALADRADRELARRSLFGALVYFVVSVAIAVATPYPQQHPAILFTAAGLALLTGAVRTFTAWRLLRPHGGSARWAKPVFLCSTYVTFIVWGLFCGWTLYLYGGEWTAMFLLLNTAALAGGATSSLAPSMRLAYPCMVLLFAPVIVSGLIPNEQTRLWPLSFVAALYVGFLMWQARENGREFWAASVAAEREKLRGSAERKRAEAQRAALIAAIEQAAEEILITGADGSIQYCNLAFERATGYSRGEVIGRNPKFLKSGKHDLEFYTNLWSTITKGGVWTGRFTNRTKDGTLYEVDGTISPIFDGGKITGFVAARRDVTERLRMEAQLRQSQKLESIGRLAGGVAHDFNNLLTVIIGYGSTLADDLQTSHPHHGYIKAILDSAEQASSLTRQLLAFSRKQIAVPKPVDLNTLVVDTQRMLQRLVGEDVEISVAVAPAPALVRIDPGQMNQILMNLAANARDAMPGGGKLELRIANLEASNNRPPGGRPDGRAVLLSVRDNGVGMNEETRQHIFEPFFSTKDKGRGTGLGLSTVYGIVQQSDGYIDVHSQPGQGATFNIVLPGFDGRLEAEETPERAEGAAAGLETVLVVEDQPEVRQFIAAALRSHGFHVLESADGPAALLLSGQHSDAIDLLLTDVIMPAMTGREVAERLAVSRPSMKVLYMSGYSGEVIAERGVLDGDVAYLAKPFTPAALIEKVRQVLGPEA